MKREFIKRISAITLLIALFLSPAVSFSQEFEDDVQDEPNAPIDSLLFAGMVAGTILGYTVLKRKTKTA